MDPILCCALGLCCPPLQRRAKIIAHYESLGLATADAERVTDDLLTRVDAFLATGVGAMLKQVFERGKAEKKE